jgi:hypothetical protein
MQDNKSTVLHAGSTSVVKNIGIFSSRKKQNREGPIWHSPSCASTINSVLAVCVCHGAKSERRDQDISVGVDLHKLGQ